LILEIILIIFSLFYDQEICWNLNNNLDYNKAEKLMHLVRVPFLDSGNPEAYLEEQSSPRTFKSHLPIQFLPDNIENNAKVKTLCFFCKTA
jgi:hypothetical protein